jgi:chromosome segregation ATPase
MERLQRENGTLARTYAACEQMLRERTGQLNQTDAEIKRLRDGFYEPLAVMTKARNELAARVGTAEAECERLLARHEQLLNDIEEWNETIAVGQTRAEQMELVIQAARDLIARQDQGYATTVSYTIRLREALEVYDANRTPLPEAFTRHKQG